ncbi:MAG: glycerate kinase [Acidobacteriota bacterium]|nr:glycerate kinase [Acidobacteriota bacterium]
MPYVPRKIVVAPDSFKESLPAAAVAAAIVAGLRDVWQATCCVAVPMADGGEGTVSAVMAATGGTIRTVTVTGPMGKPVRARFGVTPDAQTAVLEMAAASGLELVPLAERNPMRATSFGTGELLLAALDAGVSRCVLGIGGSATVDGGAGMLQALGARLLDRSGAPIGPGGAGLAQVASLDLTDLDTRLARCAIEIACDVDNPLVGPEGAARAFAAQKGATPEMIVQLETALAFFARVVKASTGADVAATPGAGAAGGVGGALLGCLAARLRPGLATVAELVGLDAAVRDADLVITGEGRIDAQSVRGKTPVGVAAFARRYGVPVFALAGSLGDGWEQVLAHGIDAAFPILPRPCTREEAFAETAINLRRTARAIASALHARGMTQ